MDGYGENDHWTIPANHFEEPHFGMADGVIVSVGLLFVGALVCLLLLLS